MEGDVNRIRCGRERSQSGQPDRAPSESSLIFTKIIAEQKGPIGGKCYSIAEPQTSDHPDKDERHKTQKIEIDDDGYHGSFLLKISPNTMLAPWVKKLSLLPALLSGFIHHAANNKWLGQGFCIYAMVR